MRSYQITISFTKNQCRSFFQFVGDLKELKEKEYCAPTKHELSTVPSEVSGSGYTYFCMQCSILYFRLILCLTKNNVSNDLPIIKWNVRFTMVTFKLSSVEANGDISFSNGKLRLEFSVVDDPRNNTLKWGLLEITSTVIFTNNFNKYNCNILY